MARRPPLIKRLEEIAARLEPGLRAAFLEAVRAVTSDVRISEIEALLRAGDIEGAVAAIGIDEAAFTPVVEQIRAGYIAGGTEAARDIPTLLMPTGRQLVVRFNVRSPRAEQWLAEKSSTLVTALAEEQRTVVRESLTAGMTAGRNPRSVALDVVGRINPATGRREGGTIVLTSQQAGYVDDARDELLSGVPRQMKHYLTRTRRDRRYDRTVQAAIDAGKPLSKEMVSKITGRYSDRLLQLRGETIARTEMLEALNTSAEEAFAQAVDTGVVDPNNIIVTWRTASDARVRESHVAINGQKRKYGEPFSNGLRFPHDPKGSASERVNCRCVAERRIDFLAGIR